MELIHYDGVHARLPPKAAFAPKTGGIHTFHPNHAKCAVSVQSPTVSDFGNLFTIGVVHCRSFLACCCCCEGQASEDFLNHVKNVAV